MLLGGSRVFITNQKIQSLRANRVNSTCCLCVDFRIVSKNRGGPNTFAKTMGESKHVQMGYGTVSMLVISLFRK